MYIYIRVIPSEISKCYDIPRMTISDFDTISTKCINNKFKINFEPINVSYTLLIYQKYVSRKTTTLNNKQNVYTHYL